MNANVNIRGLYKTSFIDFPGKIAAVCYFGGCNLRCRFCHNADIVNNNDNLEQIDSEKILEMLSRRRGLIDGVVLSGGEPTIDPGLIHFLEKLRSFEFALKLDTNGMNPGVVADCIEKSLVDYVAMDLKTSPDKYSEWTGGSFAPVLETLKILQDSGIDYEIRTTCVPGAVSKDEINEFAVICKRVPRFYLQQFISSVPLLDESLQGLQPYSRIELELFREKVLNFADHCEIRGI